VRIWLLCPGRIRPSGGANGLRLCRDPGRRLYPESPASAFEPTARAIDAAGIPAVAFNFLVPPTLPVVGPAVDLERLRRYVTLRRSAPHLSRLRLRSWERARTADPRGFPRAQRLSSSDRLPV